MPFLRTVAAVGAVAALAGCQSGAGQGAATLAGPVATGTATLVGGLAGNTVGQDLDDGDRRVALAAEYRALEYGRAGTTTPWSDRRTGRYGEVVPGAPYRVNDTTCREYAHTIYLGGTSEIGRGSACRAADGSWRTVG